VISGASRGPPATLSARGARGRVWIVVQAAVNLARGRRVDLFFVGQGQRNDTALTGVICADQRATFMRLAEVTAKVFGSTTASTQ
jgi:hypothetical protein